MRRMMGALVVVMMTAGAGAVRAQDAASMAMQAAQQANAMAMQASQTAMQMSMQAAQQSSQIAQQAAMNNGFYGPPLRPPLPMTPRPMISPAGGRFKGSVKVVIQDADPRAIVFYTTDGSVPTPRSQRYAAPIVVSASNVAKRTVRAMAFDLEAMPSGVVSKTFKMAS
jgi:Chitobiase/beta-hexosaminidase C-terminal domain